MTRNRLPVLHPNSPSATVFKDSLRIHLAWLQVQRAAWCTWQSSDLLRIENDKTNLSLQLVLWQHQSHWWSTPRGGIHCTRRMGQCPSFPMQGQLVACSVQATPLITQVEHVNGRWVAQKAPRSHKIYYCKRFFIGNNTAPLNPVLKEALSAKSRIVITQRAWYTTHRGQRNWLSTLKTPSILGDWERATKSCVFVFVSLTK